ncbi:MULTISPECIES: PAS domain-containing protein [Francisella]|uniref:Diguanylate cyclase n=1 Tax=Francisella opportunistica TaxID=2016517 RepID=A0A345JRE3_9GAMM|nr:MULTISPECIES: PAS domain-containing protein [Francisella]APC91615.1 Two-component sensor histidine kinase [Francisella sp. MA067296]AXH29889.1 diguanylate cyclase [Francisella opportunistica]AXH31536.1 diguanylate cyclase [Francisella opportunistica]AXH33184.1 diguanylate cyclase [Francisella opportunistica]
MHSNLNEYISSPLFAAVANISSENIYIYVKDTDSKYVFLSKNMCNLNNIQYQEAIGKNDSYFKWGQKQANAFRNDDLFVLNNKKPHISKYLIPKGDEFLWIKTEKIPILNKDDEAIGILGIAQNISYQKMLQPRQAPSVKTSIVASRNPAVIVLELLEEYIRNNFKNQSNIYDEYSFIRNSFIKKLSCELVTKDEQQLHNAINLEKQLKETLSIFIDNRELIIIGTGKVKTKYYIYLIICLCFIELYKNKSLREKILINIDDNTIRLMINRAGEKHKLITENNHTNNKFITNYLTPDIINSLNLHLEIFAIEGLAAAINLIIDNQDIMYSD